MQAVARRQLREVFTKIDTNGDGRIDAVDVMVSLRRLGNKCTKQEAADVLWEARRLHASFPAAAPAATAAAAAAAAAARPLAVRPMRSRTSRWMTAAAAG